MKTTTKKAIEWWADKLVHGNNSGLSDAERRSGENEAYAIAEMIMTATKPKVSDEQLQKFKESLARQLEELRPRTLAVDYGPDTILAKALADAGVKNSMGTLPIKTVMLLDDDKVSVMYGYGAPEVEL
jgi:hypothetical protein